MKKIIHICQWGKNKEKAWSGTYYKVFSAFRSFFEVEDMEIPTSFTERAKMYLHRRFGLQNYNFMFKDVLSFEKGETFKKIGKNKCVFQYTELDFPENIHSYIYQDMCIDYIVNVILPNPELMKYWKKKVSKKILDIRIKRQKKYYEKCSAIFVMGNWLKEYMVEKMHIAPEKIYCVGAGYDIDIQKINPKGRKSNKILFAGRDFVRKGGPQLLEAFKILREKYQSDAELYIAGARKPSKCVEDSNIHWMGDVSTQKLINYYNRCDILCVPSFLDPYGKVYVEALSCGMPVLALNRFATPDFVEDGKNGYLIDECEPELLAKKMYELLHDEEIKKYTLEHAEHYQKEYSWEAIAEKMASVISKDEYMT